MENIDIPPKERDKVLSFPSFPRWMIPASKHFSSTTYGPQEEVQWTPRAVPTRHETVDLMRGKRNRYGWGWTTARLGLFSKGVVFEQVIGATEIFSWKHIEFLRTPEQGYYICIWWKPDSTGGWVLFNEIDKAQAKALVSYPSHKKWDLSQALWTELGLNPGDQALPS